MSRLPLVALAAVSMLGLGAMSVPASASTSTHVGAGVPFCDATQDQIEGNRADITQRLQAQGYKVDSIQDSGGCVQAFVEKSGVSQILTLDPDYLKPVGSTANG